MILAVEFGSARRGDCNYSSDRDILLLGSSWSEIAPQKHSYESNGFSVSAFRFDRACFLAQKGSLFFKHIIDEGGVLSGSSQDFSRLSRAWRESSDFMTEARQNIDQLEVLSFVPKTTQGVLAAIDILVSSCRNILIRRLAQSGCYVFSWQSILLEAVRRGFLFAHDMPVILRARIIKNDYRQGNYPRVPVEFVGRLIEASGRACGTSIPFQFSSVTKINRLVSRLPDATYKQLRALELLCAHYPGDPALSELRSVVMSPSYFCAHGPNHSLQARRP